MKDERKTLWIRPCVGDCYDNNLSTRSRLLADCEQVFKGVESGPSGFRV